MGFEIFESKFFRVFIGILAAAIFLYVFGIIPVNTTKIEKESNND